MFFFCLLMYLANCIDQNAENTRWKSFFSSFFFNSGTLFQRIFVDFSKIVSTFSIPLLTRTCIFFSYINSVSWFLLFENLMHSLLDFDTVWLRKYFYIFTNKIFTSDQCFECKYRVVVFYWIYDMHFTLARVDGLAYFSSATDVHWKILCILESVFSHTGLLCKNISIEIYSREV